MPNSKDANPHHNVRQTPVRRQLFPEGESENSYPAVADYQFCRTLGAGGIGEAFLYQKPSDLTFWVLKKPSEDVAALRNKLKALPPEFQVANEAMVASSELKVKCADAHRTVGHFNSINQEFGLSKAEVVTVAGVQYMMAPYIGPEEKASPEATYPEATLADYLAVQVRLAKTYGRIVYDLLNLGNLIVRQQDGARQGIVVDVDLYLPIAALSEEKTQQRAEKQFGTTTSPGATVYVKRTRPARALVADEIKPAPRLARDLGLELCGAYVKAMEVILTFFRNDALAVVPEKIRDHVLDTLVKIAEKSRWDEAKKQNAFKRILALIQRPDFLRGLSAIENKSEWSDDKKRKAFQAVFALIQPKSRGLFSLPDDQRNAFCQLLPLIVNYSSDPIDRITGHVDLFAQNEHNLVTLNERIKKYTDRSPENNQPGRVAALAKKLAPSISRQPPSLSNTQTRTPGGNSVYQQSGVPPIKASKGGRQSPPEAASSPVMQVAAAGSVAILLTTAEGVAAYFEAISALTSAFAPWIIAGQVLGGIALLALGYHVAGRSTETEAQDSVLSQ